MNRIQTKLKEDKKILSIYFSAGFPNLNDTKSLIEELAKNSVDMIEIGLPFSDPLADGPTIQASSTQALKNGMTTEILFNQLKDVRKTVDSPYSELFLSILILLLLIYFLIIGNGPVSVKMPPEEHLKEHEDYINKVKEGNKKP